MREHRAFAVSVILVLLAVAAAAMWGCRVETTVKQSPERTLDGPDKPDAFSWVDVDHPYPGVEPPAPGPAAVPPLPLPADTTFGLNFSTVADPAAVDAAMGPLVAAVAVDPGLWLLIEAWASADGAEPVNHQLSLDRGQTIKAMAIALGAPADRIRVIAHGERNLPHPTTPSSAANRVVVVSAIPISGDR